eukprot:2891597-Prymnesium_polylepis.3
MGMGVPTRAMNERGGCMGWSEESVCLSCASIMREQNACLLLVLLGGRRDAARCENHASPDATQAAYCAA